MHLGTQNVALLSDVLNTRARWWVGLILGTIYQNNDKKLTNRIWNSKVSLKILSQFIARLIYFARLLLFRSSIDSADLSFLN